VRVVPESEMVSALVDEAQKIMAEGIEARIAAAEAGAEELAAAEREELVEFRGVDVNNSAERVARIREMT
jgi:(E)-4-hydroxy-3-methylbut-2-enyl-diphosphate synthase